MILKCDIVNRHIKKTVFSQLLLHCIFLMENLYFLYLQLWQEQEVLESTASIKIRWRKEHYISCRDSISSCSSTISSPDYTGWEAVCCLSRKCLLLFSIQDIKAINNSCYIIIQYWIVYQDSKTSCAEWHNCYIWSLWKYWSFYRGKKVTYISLQV